MSIEKIDKSKLRLVEEAERPVVDDLADTKSIGYYQDAFLRFKKNKASVIATILIAIIFLFTAVGPFMRNYELPKTMPGFELKFQSLPPKIPVIENLGIFDGSRVIRGRDARFWANLPDGIVLEIVGENTTANGTVLQDAKVNYYRYHSYVRSYGDKINPLVVTESMSFEQYQKALDLNSVIALHSFDVTADKYNVQLDFFKYAFNGSADDVYFWFGTNELGQDVFTNLWVASRTSILLAIAISTINILFGVIIGSIVGYYGGTLDLIFERFVDIVSNLPFLIILTLLILRFGNSIGIVILAFTATGWIGSYGVTRIQFYRYKNREYVLAARTYGGSDARIMFRHIFPNTLGTLITSFSLAIPSFIFTESIYSFLGIINYAESTSIGRMLSEGQAAMQLYPHLLLFPAIYISVLMLSFNLFSNGLRDAFNPSLRGVE